MCMVKEEQEAHPTHTQTHDSISVIDWHWFINPFNLMLTFDTSFDWTDSSCNDSPESPCASLLFIEFDDHY